MRYLFTILILIFAYSASAGTCIQDCDDKTSTDGKVKSFKYSYSKKGKSFSLDKDIGYGLKYH